MGIKYKYIILKGLCCAGLLEVLRQVEMGQGSAGAFFLQLIRNVRWAHRLRATPLCPFRSVSISFDFPYGLISRELSGIIQLSEAPCASFG